MADIRSTLLEAPNTVDAAWNLYSNRLATVGRDGSVSVLDHGEGNQLWKKSASWTPAPSQPCKVIWCHPAFGSNLAIASLQGEISLWKEQESEQRIEWKRQGCSAQTRQNVNDMSFAPYELGLLLATAAPDGHVRLFHEGSTPAAPSWQLQNDFIACSSGPCLSLSWRPHTPGTLPMLLVGSAADAKVWVLRAALGDWVPTAVVHSGAAGVSSVDWASPQGRPQELVAVASGSCVLIYSLSGSAEHLQVSRVAELEHAAPVQSVKWSLFGTWLAVCTEDCQLQQWRTNLVGEWSLQGRIVGSCSQDSGPKAVSTSSSFPHPASVQAWG